MKRLLDYERLYDSAKLESLPSDDLRSEYVWLLGIAGPNGSFEWSTRRIWATAYASIRDKTPEEVAEYLQAFLKAGLLLKWEQDGKTWGYFTGSEKPGRLPRDSWKKRFAKARDLEPAPPAEVLHGNCTSVAHNARELITEDTRTAGENGAPLSLSLSLPLSLKEKENPPTLLPVSTPNQTVSTRKDEAKPFPFRVKAKAMPEGPSIEKRKEELRRQLKTMQPANKDEIDHHNQARQ